MMSASGVARSAACIEGGLRPGNDLAPSTDLGIELVMVVLLGLLRRGRPGLLRQFTLALFDEGRKFDCTIIRNFDAWRGASNAHSGDRGIDLHIASLRDIAGNKGERSSGQ